MLILPLKGGCGCGEVRYAVSGQPLLATMCHCTTCQKRTGSAFSMNLLVMRRYFTLVQGRTITRELKTGSGSLNRHHFCEACLVRTHTEPAAHPHLTYVRPGTLDLTDDIVPTVQIWTRSAMHWSIFGGAKCYDQNMDDVADQIQAWQKANPVGQG
jgi:hypothetical protein